MSVLNEKHQNYYRPRDKMIPLALIILLTSHYCYAQIETEIPKDARKINLSNQGITELMNFEEYDNLEKVDLSHNKISKIDRNIFTANKKLKSIDLSDNIYLDIPKVGPFLFTNAESLNLTNCNIEIIPENAFDEMKNLNILDLTGNPLNFEESKLFIKNENEPVKIVVSKISDEGLKLVCKNGETLTISIRDKESLVNCKAFNKSPEGKLSENNDLQQEIENDDMQVVIEDNANLDVSEELEEMQADEPAPSDEGEITTDDSIIGDENTNEDNLNSNEDSTNSSENQSEEATPEEINADTTEVFEESTVIEEDDGNAEEQTLDVTLSPDATSEEKDETASEQSTENTDDDTKPVEETEVPKESNADQIDSNSKFVEKIENEGIQTRTVLKSNSVENTGDEENKLGKIVDASTVDAANVGGSTNIILLVIVGVVLVGGLLVGFKYWKNKREDEYSPVNKDSSPMSRELQEIKVDKNNHNNQPESKPLICDLEFKEVKEGAIYEEIDGPATKNGDVSAKDVIANPENADIPDMDASIVNIPEATNKPT